LKTSLRALLDQIIDYAGLFPPAGLDMRQTVRNYADYPMHPCSWALGRLVVPASRLDELDEAVANLRNIGYRVDRWPLSVLVGDDWKRDLGEILRFGDGQAARDAFIVDAIEIKAPLDLDDIVRIGRAMPERTTAFFEIPIDDNPAEPVAAIGAAGASAKARTGGVDESMFPTTHHVARFMECCRRNGVAFKCTAGLHHPLRSVYRLTYEPDSPTGTMHGFLNVFVGAGLVFLGSEEQDVIAVLEESSPEAFTFDDESVSWRSHRLQIDQIKAVRERFAISFGSCSFEEPIEDLKGIELL
jgi:hypothetical protein